MNYDLTQIPAGYDRGRDLDSDVLALWMSAIGARVRDHRMDWILDLGSGTGRFSETLATHFDANVIGIDPSAKMLARAREKTRDARVAYLRGRAETIPLAARSVDMVFMSMSFHHFDDRNLATRECRRVLREGGSAFVRTGTRERTATYPYVPFFPSSRSLIETLLPDIPGARDVFETAGFQFVAADVVTQVVAPDWTAYVERIAAGGDSVLARLTPPEFDAGLARLRGRARQARRERVVEAIDLLVFR